MITPKPSSNPMVTRKSTITDFILVCPDLKSSPPIMTLCLVAVRGRVRVGVRVGVRGRGRDGVGAR